MPRILMQSSSAFGVPGGSRDAIWIRRSKRLLWSSHSKYIAIATWHATDFGKREIILTNCVHNDFGLFFNSPKNWLHGLLPAFCVAKCVGFESENCERSNSFASQQFVECRKKILFIKKKLSIFARFECRKKLAKHGWRQTNSSGVISDVNLEFWTPATRCLLKNNC